MLKTPMRFMPLLFVLGACGHLTVTTPPVRCADLVPAHWADGVSATPPPALVPADFGASVCASATPDARPYCIEARRAQEGERRYAAAFIAEGGQLEKANGRMSDSMGIVRQCETLVNEARPG